jgi:hypothetical protein
MARELIGLSEIDQRLFKIRLGIINSIDRCLDKDADDEITLRVLFALDRKVLGFVAQNLEDYLWFCV